MDEFTPEFKKMINNKYFEPTVENDIKYVIAYRWIWESISSFSEFIEVGLLCLAIALSSLDYPSITKITLALIAAVKLLGYLSAGLEKKLTDKFNSYIAKMGFEVRLQTIATDIETGDGTSNETNIPNIQTDGINL